LNAEGRKKLDAVDVSDAMTTLWMAWIVVLVLASIYGVLNYAF